MMRKVIKTKYSDIRTPKGAYREAVWCELECGHHVVQYYNRRKTYDKAQCKWCNLEKRDGARYVWRKKIPYDLNSTEPDYTLDVTQKPYDSKE